VAARIATIRGRNLQIVIVIDVALGASGYLARRSQLVGVRQGKASCAVIESGVGPTRRIVASRALRNWEACRNVVWNIAAQRLRAVPLCKVAAGVTAVGWRDL